MYFFGGQETGSEYGPTITPTVGGPGTRTPSGTVSFFAAGKVLGVATLHNGVATLSTTTLRTPGSYQVIARYSGDSNFGANASAPIIQKVRR